MKPALSPKIFYTKVCNASNTYVYSNNDFLTDEIFP
jgi:hypothetical protein